MMTLLTLITAIGAFISKAITIIIILGLIVFFLAVNVQFIKENLDNRQ
jgi:hypothetical protein